VPGADRPTLLAHLKLGDTYQLLGQTDDAIKEWSRASAMAAELVARDPDDILSRRDHSRAEYNLGYVANRMTDFAAADKHMAAAIATLEEARRRRPDDLPVFDNLAVAYAGRGDIYWLSQKIAPALADYDRARRLQEATLAKEPDNAAVRSKLFYSVSRIGYVRISLQHDYEGAVDILRELLLVCDDQLKKTPTDRTWQRNLHATRLDLAIALHRLGNLAGAEAAARESLAWFEPLAASEPENVAVQRDLSTCLTDIGLATLAADRCGEAEAAFARSYAVLDKFANRSGTASYVAYDLPGICYNLSLALWRQRKYDEAAKWVGTAADHYRKMTGLSLIQKKNVLDALGHLQVAFTLTPKAIADPAFAFTQPPEVAQQLACLRVLYLARTGNDADARRELKVVREKYPKFAGLGVCEASVDGLAAGRTPDPEEKRRLVAAGVQTLLDSIKADRTILDTFPIPPELVPIRSDPAFRKGLMALIEAGDRK
jgi:tetratricopeptide (TPR) repeat protein